MPGIPTRNIGAFGFAAKSGGERYSRPLNVEGGVALENERRFSLDEEPWIAAGRVGQ
jgi:hypothetical protein